MRIGIDIDDTITKTHEYVIYLKKKHLPEYNPYELLPDEIFKSFIDKYERDIHQNVELKNGVKEALDYIHEKGHKIIILSSRGSFYKTITEDTAYQDSYDYFIKNKLHFDKLYTNLKEKTEICKENKIDLFIDDNIKVCQSVEDAGIRVIKMFREDDKESDFEIAKNWQDIIKIIKEMN